MWREERSKATRVRGQREEHRSDDALAEQRSSSSRGERMKRTEKSKANGRQEEHSQKQAKQPKDCDRDKAKHEEKHSKVQGEAQYKARLRQPASPEASKNRCRCPAGAGRSDHDHPKDRLQPDTSEAATQVQKIVKDYLSEEDCTMTVSSAARRLHDEVQRNPDGQEATFSFSQDRKHKAQCLRQ